MLCTVLASHAAAVSVESPQQIEQVTEWKWCRDGAQMWLIQSESYRIDGKGGIRENNETVWRRPLPSPSVEPVQVMP